MHLVPAANVVVVRLVAGAVVTTAVAAGDLVVAGSDPPEQASVPKTVIPIMTTAKMTLAISLIETRKL